MLARSPGVPVRRVGVSTTWCGCHPLLRPSVALRCGAFLPVPPASLPWWQAVLAPMRFRGLSLCYCLACLGTPACEGLGLLLRRGTVVSGSPSRLALSADGLFSGHSWKGALPVRLLLGGLPLHTVLPHMQDTPECAPVFLKTTASHL